MRTTQKLIWLPTGGHIGDAVMILSLFSETLERNPNLRIFYLVRRNAPFIADLAAAYPAITVVSVPYDPWGALKTVLPLFKDRAMVIAPPAWGKHPLSIKFLAFSLRVRGDRVVGFNDGGAWQPYSTSIRRDPSVRYIDNLRRAFALMPLQTDTIGASPRLTLRTSLPKDFPFTDKPYILLHPFPHMSTRKTLPLRRWKTLLKALQHRYPSYGIVLTGAEIDHAQAVELAAHAPRVYLSIGRSLIEVAGLIERATLYIGVDTGPTHIAGVLQVPSVILAQQKEPMWLTTYNPNALLIWSKETCTCGIPEKPCEVWEDGQPYRRCVYDLSDKDILAAIECKLPAPPTVV